MSCTRVGMAIDKLLADENLRIRFARDRIDTIAELCRRGMALTRDDIDVLYETDLRLWSLAEELRCTECWRTRFP